METTLWTVGLASVISSLVGGIVGVFWSRRKVSIDLPDALAEGLVRVTREWEMWREDAESLFSRTEMKRKQMDLAAARLEKAQEAREGQDQAEPLPMDDASERDLIRRRIKGAA